MHGCILFIGIVMKTMATEKYVCLYNNQIIIHGKATTGTSDNTVFPLK